MGLGIALELRQSHMCGVCKEGWLSRFRREAWGACTYVGPGTYTTHSCQNPSRYTFFNRIPNPRSPPLSRARTRRDFGKCWESWMVDGGYCSRACGRAPCPPTQDAMEDFAVKYSKQQPGSTGSGSTAGSATGSSGTTKTSAVPLAPSVNKTGPSSSNAISGSSNGSGGSSGPAPKEGEDFIDLPQKK